MLAKRRWEEAHLRPYVHLLHACVWPWLCSFSLPYWWILDSEAFLSLTSALHRRETLTFLSRHAALCPKTVPSGARRGLGG